jgi:hypothetical protein
MEKIKLLFKVSFPIFNLFLSACTIGRIPLNETKPQTIHQSQQVLASKQKNIEIEEIDSNGYAPPGVGTTAGVAGMVFASIVAHHENVRNQQAITQLTQHFEDGYFNQLMNQSLNQELGNIKWLHITKHQVIKPLSVTEQINKLSKVGDAIIYVDFSYMLPNLAIDSLHVKAKVSIYQKELPKAVLIYQNSFTYIDFIEKKSQAYLGLWSKHHGKRFKESIME